MSVKTSDLSRGRWATVYAHLLPDLKQQPGKGQPCPNCGGTDRFDLFRDWQEKGAFNCRHCGHGDGFELIGRVTGQPFSEVCRIVEGVLGISGNSFHVERQDPAIGKARQQRDTEQANEQAKGHLETLHRIMGGVVPLNCFEPGLAYLRNRGLGELVERGDLPRNWLGHWSPNYHKGTHGCPALVAPIVVAGQPMALHCTYITITGEKAFGSNSKRKTKPLWTGATRGGAVRLIWPIDKEIAVTEGIENGLAVRQSFPDLCVWSAVDAGGLGNFMAPEGVERVQIWADHDDAGRRAAAKLSERLRKKRIRSVTLLPPEPGRDWLDIARRAAA